MKVTIEFETGNAAFADSFHGELKKVLDQCYERVLDQFHRETDDDERVVRDTNGDTIGKVTFKGKW